MGCSPSIWATMHALSPTAHTVHTGSLAGEGVEKKKKKAGGEGRGGEKKRRFLRGKERAHSLEAKKGPEETTTAAVEAKQKREGKEWKGKEWKGKKRKKKKKKKNG